jgi:ATP-binding cassette subfamily B protein
LASGSLRRFVPYLRPQRHLVALTLVAALVSLVAAVSIPQVIKVIIDGPIAHRHIDELVPFAALLVGLAVVEAVANHIRRNYSVLASLHMETDMRNDFYAHLQSLQVSFHDNWQSGQLLSRAISDIQTVRRFIGFGLIFAAFFGATFLGVLVMLFRLDPLLAALTALVALPVAFLSRRFFRAYGLIARRVQDQSGDLTTVIEEAATGTRIVKSFGRGASMIERFEKEAARLRSINMEAVRVRSWAWTQFSFFPNLNLALVLLIGGLAVLGGSLSIGGLVAFMTYLFMLIWPLDAIGWVFAMGEEAATASDRLVEVFDSRPDIADRPGARDLAPGAGRIVFEHVGFRYPGTQAWILRDVNLVIEPGETLALVGRTGCGKSTLLHLVPRLYDVSEGRITIDGVDVRDLRLRSLRSQVGVAFEEPILFSASVHENLVMGRPIDSDGELRRALEVAQAGFVWELPWGLETRVGEQGHTLSGGQRQRLALARAVLGGPRVLVLDDPLSSVDVHTEAAIESALQSVLQGVTALLVVHRPSTLALADRVALIEEGTVFAAGTHSELMASNELYRALLSQEAEKRLVS